MEIDSPENELTSAATTAAAAAAIPSDSVALSDSAIFSYINNLSPIKPVKAAPVVPDFQGLSSPPIVFTSPHLNPLRESNSLKSSQCPQLSSTELFQKDDGNKKNETNSGELEKSQSQSSSVLVPCVDKDCDNKGSVEDQPASPSGCNDEYLADGADVDSGNSAHSATLSLVQSDDMSQSLNDGTDLKETEENFNKNDTRQDAEQAASTFPGTLELSGKDFHGKSLIENKPVETDAKQGGSERPSSVCLEIKSGFSVDHASEEQHCELPVAQHAGASHKDELDCGSAFLSESVQPIQGYEDCNKTARETSNESFGNMVLPDPMGQHHRTMHRRCLRFEEVEQIVIENTPLWSSSNVVTNSRLPDSPADLEVSESSCLEISTTSSGRQLDHLTQPIISMISPRNSGNCRSIVSKPSGIGLHLNSVVNTTLACGASGNMKSVDKAYLSEQGRKMVSVSIMGGHRPKNKRNSSTLSNVRQNFSTSSKDGSHETQVSVVTSSLASWPPKIMKSSNDTTPSEQSGCRTTPCDEMKSMSGHAEELNHLSPKKKRKKALVTDDGDGCKRCNCKKSKCLKLYCDCFAAGIYCAEPCACQGCFNRLEYEDTVLETRQQIESRNPLAFSPKVVHHLINSPAASNEEDGNNSTPSSARHKRGCNCKKSMCLKKYCECYQSNVGCSNGCRCEGCKNVFGRKEEYVAPKELMDKGPVKERFKSTSDENLEMLESGDGLLQAEMCNQHNLTPLTPSFQFSNHGKDASKAQLSTRRCLPSPESNLTLPKSPESPGTSDNLDMLLQDGKDIQGIESCNQELICSNIERMDHEFSTAYDGYANVCAASRMPNPPSTAMAYSMSSKISEWTTVSRAQLCPGSGHLSSVSSLHWRILPMTPVNQFGGDKLPQAVDSDDDKLHNQLHNELEDDTPEILKNASSPNNAVKVSSPNKKRVAPPRNCLSELWSSSSSALRSGRKFILQAVPSFPPLTPCMDSKGCSTGHNVNDPQDFSEK